LAALKPQPLPQAVSAGDLGRAVEPQRRGQAAVPRPEGRKRIAAVANDGHPAGLQRLQRLGQVEDGLGPRADDGDGGLGQFVEIGAVIDAAVAEAAAGGVRGKAVTPFLLQRVMERTEGRSLAANVALIESNARLAAEVALALQRESLA
jgi:hypothetical protein